MKHISMTSLLLALLCGISLQASQQWKDLRTTQDQRDFEDADTELIEENESSVDEQETGKARESVMPNPEELEDLLSGLRSSSLMKEKTHEAEKSFSKQPTWFSKVDNKPTGQSRSLTNSPKLAQRRERSKTFAAVPTVPQVPSSPPKEERKSPRLFTKKQRSPRGNDGPASPVQLTRKPRSLRIKRRQHKIAPLAGFAIRKSDNPKPLVLAVPQEKRLSLDLESESSPATSPTTLSKSANILLRLRSPRALSGRPVEQNNSSSESPESTSPPKPGLSRREFSEQTRRDLHLLKKSAPEVSALNTVIAYLNQHKKEKWVNRMYEEVYSATTFGGIEVSEETFSYLYDQCILSLDQNSLKSSLVKAGLTTPAEDLKKMAIQVVRDYIDKRVDGLADEALHSPQRRLNKSPRSMRTKK